MELLASHGANCCHTWVLQLPHRPNGSVALHCYSYYADDHASRGAMLARLHTLQLLHWPRRSLCPSAAVVVRITMLQPLTRHTFPHVSNCCTGTTHYSASCSLFITHVTYCCCATPIAYGFSTATGDPCRCGCAHLGVVATYINMLQPLHWPQGSACSTCTAAPLLKGGRRTTR